MLARQVMRMTSAQISYISLTLLMVLILTLARVRDADCRRGGRLSDAANSRNGWRTAVLTDLTLIIASATSESGNQYHGVWTW